MAAHEKLKPCPFCGGSNLLTEPYYEESYVHCQDCKTDGPAGDYAECEKLWNKRPREKLSEANGAAKAVIALEQHRSLCLMPTAEDAAKNITTSFAAYPQERFVM